MLPNKSRDSALINGRFRPHRFRRTQKGYRTGAVSSALVRVERPRFFSMRREESQGFSGNPSRIMWSTFPALTKDLGSKARTMQAGGPQSYGYENIDCEKCDCVTHFEVLLTLATSRHLEKRVQTRERAKLSD